MKLVQGMRKLGALVLAVCLVACLWAAPAQARMELNIDYAAFEDLPAVSWYSNYMKKALEEHFFYGISRTLFDPNRAITRGEAVTVLSRLYESLSNTNIPNYGGVSTFSDVAANRFYANPIVWAQREGIATGVTEDAFGPDNPVTQQELAVMIDKFLDAYDSAARRAPLAESEVNLTGVADWAKEAVVNISGYEVFTAAHWNPTAPALRGDCSAFFVRLYERIVAGGGAAVPCQEYRYAFPAGSVAEDFTVVPESVAGEGTDRIGRVRLIKSYSEYREIVNRVESFCQPVAVQEQLDVDESSFGAGRNLAAIEIKSVGKPDFNAELASSGTLQNAGKFTFSCTGYTESAQKDITGQIFFVSVPSTVADAKDVECAVLRWTEDVPMPTTPTPSPSPSPSPTPTPDPEQEEHTGAGKTVGLP